MRHNERLAGEYTERHGGSEDIEAAYLAGYKQCRNDLELAIKRFYRDAAKSIEPVEGWYVDHRKQFYGAPRLLMALSKLEEVGPDA